MNPVASGVHVWQERPSAADLRLYHPDAACCQEMVSLLWRHNSFRPRRSRRHFADDIFKRIFLNENIRISIKISLKFVPESPMDNIPPLFQIMAWRRPGDKPLSETMVESLLTHICVTRPQWVNMETLRHYCPTDFQWCSRKYLGSLDSSADPVWKESTVEWLIPPTNGQLCRASVSYFVVIVNNLVKKQLSCLWFETPWY